MATSEQSLELRFSRSGKTVTVVNADNTVYQIRDPIVREQIRIALQQYIDDEQIDNSFEFFSHLYPRFYRSVIETAFSMREARAMDRLAKRWQPWFRNYMGAKPGELLDDEVIEEFLLSHAKDPVREDHLAFDGAVYYEIDSDLMHGKPFFARTTHFRDGDNRIDVIDDVPQKRVFEESEEMSDASSVASDSTHMDTERNEADVDLQALANYIKQDKLGNAPTDISKHLLLPGLRQKIDDGNRATQRVVAQLLTSPEFTEALDRASWTLGDNSARLWSEHLQKNQEKVQFMQLTHQGYARLQELEQAWNGETTGNERDDSMLEALEQLSDGPHEFQLTPIVQHMLSNDLIEKA